MGNSPVLMVDVYDQDQNLISSNRPSYLRKIENERVEKKTKAAAAAKAKAKAKSKPKKEVESNGILTPRATTEENKPDVETPTEEKKEVEPNG